MSTADEKTDNLWPGYVAAMASLLLGLLLVAAVLVVTTGQISHLSESYQQAILAIGFKSGKEVDRLALAAGLQDGAALGEGAGPLGTGQGKVEEGQARMLSQGKGDAQKESSSQAALDLVNANFNHESARKAALLAANDKTVLAQIDLSKVDVKKIGFTGIDIAKVDLAKQILPTDLKKIDFSAVQFGQLSQSRIDTLKPFVAKEGIRYQLALQKQKSRPAIVTAPALTAVSNAAVDARPPHAPETTAVAAVAKPNEIKLSYIEDAIEPLAEQKQLIVQSLAALNRPDSKWRLWVSLPGDDIYLKRIAYSRLMSVRAMALEAGFSSARVNVVIEPAPNSAPLLREMTLHMSEVRP